MQKYGLCLWLIVAASLVSGCAKGGLVDAGVGSKMIYLTAKDQKVISDGLMTQILEHDEWCEEQPKCQKLNPKTGEWGPKFVKP